LARFRPEPPGANPPAFRCFPLRGRRHPWLGSARNRLAQTLRRFAASRFAGGAILGPVPHGTAWRKPSGVSLLPASREAPSLARFRHPGSNAPAKREAAKRLHRKAPAKALCLPLPRGSVWGRMPQPSPMDGFMRLPRGRGKHRARKQDRPSNPRRTDSCFSLETEAKQRAED